MMASGDADTPPFDGDEKPLGEADDDDDEDDIALDCDETAEEEMKFDGISGKEPTTAPILQLTDVVRKGPAVYIQGRASFPANTADGLIENIVLGKEMTDFELFFDEDETDDGLSKDIDKGWAWMVLFGGFMAFSLLSGLFNTISIYYVVFQQAFGQSKHYTAWASSLHCAFSFLGGPVSSFMILKLGCRWTIISGGLLSAVGYIGTSFAPNLETVLFTYGVVTALGLSLNFSGWVIALGSYFNRKHSIATALAMTGFGCGLFFLGPGMEANVNHYGWRGSLIINAGIALHFCVFGALVYPITFTGYVGDEDSNGDGDFERKFFKDWEETQSLPPPEPDRLSIDLEKPGTTRKASDDHINRKISTVGELKGPPPSFMRPNVHSTMSMDTGLKKTAFTHVPGTSEIFDPRSKRTYSSASIRSTGSASSLQCGGSMKDMRFSPAAAFLSHSIRSLNEVSGKQKGRTRAYIAVGMHKQFSSNSSLPCLVGSRESVRSLEDDFRGRTSSCKDERTTPRTKGQIYRKPQILEDDECIAEDLIKTLNDPQVVSLKPKKSGKGKKAGKHKHGLQHQQSAELKEEADEVKEEILEKKPDAERACAILPEEEQEKEKLLTSPGKTDSDKDKKVESGSETGDNDEDDDEDEPEEVWKLKAAMKAAARAQPPKSSFLRFFMPSYDANPRAISNIEEVDESAIGSSLMSLNAIFRRKSREVLSRLSSDNDLKGKQHEASCPVNLLPGIKEETKQGLPAITEEDEKKRNTKEPSEEKKPEDLGDVEDDLKESKESLGVPEENLQKEKTPKQAEEAAPVEVGEAQGTWRTHLRTLWYGENPDEVPLFKDIRFWCFNYSGMVWMMGTLTLYVLYKDFALEKNMVERFIYALSGLGLGDLMGRLFSGTFVSWSFINSVLIYGLSQLACGVVILYHMTIKTSEEFIILCVCLGVCYGTQNVLLAVAPGEVYGSSHLTIVFGNILFFCGLGAIMGPPMASLLVQHYEDYSAAFIFAGVSTLTGGIATLSCFYIDWRWRQAKEKKRKEGLSDSERDFELKTISA